METEQEQISTSLKPVWKAVLYLSAGLLAFVSLDVVLDALFSISVLMDAREGVVWPTYFFSALFLASIASIIYTGKYRLLINENGIRQKGAFSTYTIHFDDIDKIVFDTMLIIIHGNGKSVSLGNLYNDYEEAAQFIFDRLEERDDLVIEGKQKYIDRYLADSRLI